MLGVPSSASPLPLRLILVEAFASGFHLDLDPSSGSTNPTCSLGWGWPCMSGTEDVKALSQQFVSRGHFLLCFIQSSQVGAITLSFLVGSAMTPRTFPLALACSE